MTTSKYFQSTEREHLNGRESKLWDVDWKSLPGKKVAPGQNFEGSMELKGWKEISRPLRIRTFIKTQE